MGINIASLFVLDFLILTVQDYSYRQLSTLFFPVLLQFWKQYPQMKWNLLDFWQLTYPIYQTSVPNSGCVCPQLSNPSIFSVLSCVHLGKLRTKLTNRSVLSSPCTLLHTWVVAKPGWKALFVSIASPPPGSRTKMLYNAQVDKLDKAHGACSIPVSFLCHQGNTHTGFHNPVPAESPSASPRAEQMENNSPCAESSRVPPGKAIDAGQKLSQLSTWHSDLELL